MRFLGGRTLKLKTFKLFCLDKKLQVTQDRREKEGFAGDVSTCLVKWGFTPDSRDLRFSFQSGVLKIIQKKRVKWRGLDYEGLECYWLWGDYFYGCISLE